jgi:hypothetical protein
MDELQNGVPGVPAGTEPGQPETTAPEQQVPAVDLSKIDLDDLPQGRALKSTLQKQISEAEKRAQQAERNAQIAAQQVNLLYQAIQEDDPQRAQSVNERLAAAARQAEFEMTKQELAELQWERDITLWGAEQGINVNSEDFRRAVANRDNGWFQAEAERIEQAEAERQRAAWFDEELRKRGIDPAALTGGAAAPPASQPEAQPQAKQRPSVGILPPSGGSAVAAKLTDAEHNELQRLYGEPTKNAARIRELESRLGR